MTTIDVYTWPTPNGHKVHIMLEETGLAYRVCPVNIGAGEQFKPEFLAISPNNKIPAIVDPAGPGGKPMSLAESGAILFYLASKTGRFLPQDVAARWQVMQWVMFQMGHVGPMFGQANHFVRYATEQLEYPIKRYTREAARLCNVMDRRLGRSAYMACDEYTIADMAIFPWLRSLERLGIDLSDYPALQRWQRTIAARPAVARGLKVLAERQRSGPASAAERENLFGARQYERR